MSENLLPNEPLLMPKQNEAFNGDYFACNEFLKLKERFSIDTIVELGSCVFGSTKWFAENFDRVYTIEINEQYRNIGLQRTKDIKNIHSYLGSTIDVLPEVLKNCKDNTIIFVDSHWHTLPIFDELRIISESGLKCCIVIHDCLVPNEPNLGFDSYDGVDISYDSLKNSIDLIYGEDNYEYHYNSDKESTEVKRGIIYIQPKK